MAKASARLTQNVSGDFYVDASCIDCDQCRQIAPAVFSAHEDKSIVYHQPATPRETLRAGMALLTCPTSSIGTDEKHNLESAIAAYPEKLAEGVTFCGFAAESSFGASSYLIVRPQGNVLVDSPRFATPLVRRIEEMGGVSLMFLSHVDDVADHEKFKRHFGAQRLMHEGDIDRGTASIEQKIKGCEPVRLAEDLLVIPTPGHTRGHQVLLFKDTFLFTGDHLWWNPTLGRLDASKRHCWYSWPDQIRSMETLLHVTFEWVLPGHGHRHHASQEAMRQSLSQCIAWMKRVK